MSVPSMVIRPCRGSKVLCSRPSVVDLPEPVAPTSAIVYAFGYLKAVTTGEPSRAGEIGKIEAM